MLLPNAGEDHPVTDLLIGEETVSQLFQSGAIQQVDLVDQEEGSDSGVLRCHQKLIDQFLIDTGPGCSNDDDAIHIGGNRSGTATGVYAGEEGATRQTTLYHPSAVDFTPGHPVTTDDTPEISPCNTAMNGPFLILYIKKGTVVGNHQTGLFWLCVRNRRSGIAHLMFAASAPIY